MKQLICVLLLVLAASPAWAQSKKTGLTRKVGKAARSTQQSRALSAALDRRAGHPQQLKLLGPDGKTVAQGQQVPMVGLQATLLTFPSAEAAQRYVPERPMDWSVSALAEVRGTRVLELRGSALDDAATVPDVRKRAWKALGVGPSKAGALGYYNAKTKFDGMWTSGNKKVVDLFEQLRRNAGCASPTAQGGTRIQNGRVRFQAERHGDDVRMTHNPNDDPAAKVFGQMLPPPPKPPGKPKAKPKTCKEEAKPTLQLDLKVEPLPEPEPRREPPKLKKLIPIKRKGAIKKLRRKLGG